MEIQIPETLVSILAQLNMLPVAQAATWALLGAQHLWSLFGWWCLLALPLLPLVIVAITRMGLVALRHYLSLWRSDHKASCPRCDAANHPAATSCRECREALPDPVHVDALGLVTRWPATNREVHAQHLLAAGRCPECAEPLPRRTPRQRCRTCSAQVFASTAHRDRYLAQIRGDFHSTLGICLAFSSFPLLGLIPWVLYDAVSLPAKLRRFAKERISVWERFRLRIVVLTLLAIQGIPVLGACSLPLICLVESAVYGRALADASLAGLVPAGREAQNSSITQASVVSS